MNCVICGDVFEPKHPGQSVCGYLCKLAQDAKPDPEPEYHRKLLDDLKRELAGGSKER